MKKLALLALAAILSASVASSVMAEKRSVEITAGGDVMLGGSKAKGSYARFEQFVNTYGDGYVLKNLRGLFSTDDITIVNLEGPLKGAPSPRKPNKSFNIYGKPAYARILTTSSVEAVNIANNHINDYNTKKDTQNILNQYGIVHSDESYNGVNNTIVVNGVSVGFIGFQTPYKYSDIRKAVRKVKRQCDICVISFHFCHVPVGTWKIQSSQMKYAHIAINAGADLVLGHHPHVVSGVELYKEKLIFYGLGSLTCSGRNFTRYNIVARITLDYDDVTGEVTTRTPIIYPGYSSSAGLSKQNNCQPVLFSPGDEGYEWVFDRIDEASSRKGMEPAEYERGEG
ncbi:MAG: CapA family protein [Clostridia bacterium]|nr:CapA family protein [Clostridia bacterium]